MAEREYSKTGGEEMKKKLLFLTAVMLILTMSIFTGCGSKDTADDGSWKYVEDNVL